MDIGQLTTLLERTLNFIQEQGPGALDHFASALQSIQDGVIAVGALATLLAKYPDLSKVVDELIRLIQSGAGTREIAVTIAELASHLKISIDVLLKLIQLLANVLGLL